MRAATLSFVILALVAAVSAQVVCTVGVSGTYSTVNAALAGCNGGAGSIKLLLDGVFTETMSLPATLTNVTFTSVEFAAGLVPAVPYRANITTAIIGSEHRVGNVSASLYFQGIILDGNNAGLTMFTPWLINNNFTMDRCFVANWTTDIAIRLEPCERAALLNVVNTRFYRVWGTTVYAEGMEDTIFVGNVLDRVGGYHNHSGVYLKASYVTEGVWRVENNSGWLIFDAQPPSCIFLGDTNGMVRCNRGVLECYNVLQTAVLRPNCLQVNTSYVLEGTNTTLTTTDYPQECRIYTPCVCQDLEFFSVNTSSTVILAIGDVFFYTGLRLNCSAISGDTPFIVLTGTTSVTDPQTNVTNTVTNDQLFQFVASHAGQAGIGQAPPFTDPNGFSLYPNVYVRGEVANQINCSCPPGVNTSMENFGFQCDYTIIKNDTICSNGVVTTCDGSFEFLRCYPADSTLVRFLQGAGGSADATTLVSTYCLANGSLVMPNTSISDTPCDAALAFNASSGWTFFLVANQYACLSSDFNGTTYEVVTAGLDDASAAALCLTDPDLIAAGCPVIPANPGDGQFTVSCATCSDVFSAVNQLILVTVCKPYRCPITWNVTCNYTYVTNTSSLTHVRVETQSYSDGRTWSLPNGNLWDNGDALCATTDPDEVAWQAIQCQQQIDAGNPCAPAASQLAGWNATQLSPAFPYNQTSFCGAPYTCVTPLSTICSCDVQQVAPCLAEYEVGNGSAMFHFDNINDGLGSVSMTFNRAQQLYVGMLMDRTSEAVIMNNSIFAPQFSTHLSRLYEWLRQNYQTTGILHDAGYGLYSQAHNVQPYQRFCDNGCPLEFTSEDDFDCIVDASIPIEQQDNVYQSIQDADDDGCNSIVIRNPENNYAENLDIENAERIYSFDGACIIGNGHLLGVDTLDIRGVCFIHPGDEPKALFSPKGGMDQLWIRDCSLEGSGVRAAGLLPLKYKSHIKDFVINNTLINTWNLGILNVNSKNGWVSNFVFTNNLIIDCIGRNIEVKYDNIMRVHSNTFVDSRGTGSTKGASLIRVIARTLGKYGQQQNDQDRSCSDSRERDYGNNCAFYNNVQIVDRTEDDQPDVCWMIQGGAIGVDDIFDNVCVKASIGMQLRQLDVITAASLALVLSNNPMIRPSAFRTTASAKSVADFAFDQYYTTKDKPFVFVPYQRRKCNYPCDLNIVLYPVCTVNPNFQVGYTCPDGAVCSPYGQLSFSGFGFGIFTNASHMLDFCGVQRANPYTGAVEYAGYFTGARGGRMFRDVFQVNKTGVSFYGALLPDESNIPPECFPRSVIYGDGWQLLADNWTSVNMSYRLDNRAMDQVTHMFYTTPSLVPVWHVNVTNNTFDGSNLVPYDPSYALRLVMDIDEDTYAADKKRRRGGRKFPDLNKQPDSIVVIRNNTFQNFAGFNPLGNVDPETGETYNTTLKDYPFSNPIYIEFQNQNANKSYAYIDGNLFLRVDDRSLDIREMTYLSFRDNRLVDVGERSYVNPAGILITGSPFNPSFVDFYNNTINQTREVLFDRTGSRIQPGWYSQVWFTGFLPQSKICVFDNRIGPDGSAHAIRWSGMNESVVDSCIDASQLAGFFHDANDFLRKVWYYNQDADGYIHDLVYGYPYQDFFQTWIYCDDGCVPVMDACNVSLTDPYYTPQHPFWNKLVFTDLSLANTNCTHPSGRIRVRYNDPSTAYSFSGPVVFPAGHDALNASMPIRDVFGEYAGNSTAAKVRINVCGQQVLNGRVRFSNFAFVHICGTGPPTWDMNVPDPSPDPLQLEFIDNTWDGQGIALQAINGTADNYFRLGDLANTPGGKQVFYKALQTGAQPATGRGNVFNNYIGDKIVNIAGRSCAVDVFVVFNIWNTCPGNCITVQGVGGIDYDLNTLNNAIATLNVDYGSLVSVCQPVSTVSHHLFAHDNRIQNGSAYNPTLIGPSGGYKTGFAFNPVPTNFMKVEIKRTRGFFPGVCFREDNKPASYPLSDPQLPARKISQRDYNIHCEGGEPNGGMDIRLNCNGPADDLLIQANPTIYKACFCNNGCPHVTDLQYAILIGLATGLIFSVFIVVMMCCLCGYRRTRYYYSMTAGEWADTSTGKLISSGTVARMNVATRREVRDEFEASITRYTQ